MVSLVMVRVLHLQSDHRIWPSALPSEGRCRSEVLMVLGVWAEGSETVRDVILTSTLHTQTSSSESRVKSIITWIPSVVAIGCNDRWYYNNREGLQPS